MIRGLENMTYEERLKGLGLFSLQTLKNLINAKDVKYIQHLKGVIGCPFSLWQKVPHKEDSIKSSEAKTPQVCYLGRDQSILWQIFSVLDKYHEGLGNSLSHGTDWFQPCGPMVSLI